MQEIEYISYFVSIIIERESLSCLGNISDSQNIELLKKNGITHIINATPDAPIQNEKEFRSIRIPVLDLPSENIQQHFEKTTEFIGKFNSNQR